MLQLQLVLLDAREVEDIIDHEEQERDALLDEAEEVAHLLVVEGSRALAIEYLTPLSAGRWRRYR